MLSMDPGYNYWCREVKSKKTNTPYNRRCRVDGMIMPERLKKLISDRGLSQSELGRRVGVSQATIAKLITGGGYGSKHLHKIAYELGTTPAYLTGETDDPDEGAMPLPTAERIAEQLDSVPIREIDLTFGMGSTYFDVPVSEKIQHFPREWIRQYTHTAPENLIFAQGVGDSMFPTLLDSDLMLIDCSQKTLNMSDKIWAVSYADCGMIKRLRPVPGGGVAILSDNPAVPDITAYDGELHILGRVVAIVRKY